MAVEVDIVTASCCTRGDIEQKIQRVLRRLEGEIPGLRWKTIDVTEQPELAVQYQVPATPAVFIDRELAFIGFPKEAALEAKVRQRAQQAASAVAPVPR
jgi:hypothetical protein